jgi:DNA-binding transcriptional regulator YdaS (Cro superfamily)
MKIEKTAIEKACEIAGSQSELARKLGVKPQAVQKWVSAGEVPVKRALAIQKATEGKITAQQLCPLFYQGA